jgi:hypothetical protein
VPALCQLKRCTFMRKLTESCEVGVSHGVCGVTSSNAGVDAVSVPPLVFVLLSQMPTVFEALSSCRNGISSTGSVGSGQVYCCTDVGWSPV